jgi:mono/diheme cytochrome c family protein
MKSSQFTLAMCALFLWAASSCGGGKENPQEKAVAGQPAETTSAKKEAVPVGKGVYNTYCMVCHQADGQGVEAMNPPLVGSDWVTGDKNRLIGVVLNGLSGEIEVNGVKYNNVMAAHNFLTDQQIADVLTYVRSSWGNNASAVTEAEVAAVRAQ